MCVAAVPCKGQGLKRNQGSTQKAWAKLQVQGDSGASFGASAI